MVFTWSRRRRNSICLIYLVSLILRVYDIQCLWYLLSYASRGAPAWLYICNQARVYKCPSRIWIRVFLLLLQVIFESLYLYTSLMGRARYTNSRVPEGHTLVSSPRDSIRVADSGSVSKLQIFNFINSLTSSNFNLWLLQTSTSSNFNLWLLQTSTSSNFNFFNLRLRFFDFLKSSGSWICTPDGSEISSRCLWCLPPTMDSKFSSSFFLK
jgi:hypothetical protein